jgi:Leucine-rich repeat (LRR) protein
MNNKQEKMKQQIEREFLKKRLDLYYEKIKRQVESDILEKRIDEWVYDGILHEETSLAGNFGDFTAKEANEMLSEICKMKWLKSLTVRRMRGILPDSIGNLENLEYLDLQSNELEFVPESIGNLKKLEVFALSANNLESLPESIGKLTELKKLYVERNKLKSLPESFCNLVDLKILDISHNEFECLPENIRNLDCQILFN